MYEMKIMTTTESTDTSTSNIVQYVFYFVLGYPVLVDNMVQTDALNRRLRCVYLLQNIVGRRNELCRYSSVF